MAIPPPEAWGEGGLPPTPPRDRSATSTGPGASSSFSYVPTQLPMPHAAPILFSVDIDMPELWKDPPREVNLVDAMERLQIPPDVLTVGHLRAWIMADCLPTAPANLAAYDLIVSRPDPRRQGRQEPLYDHFELYRRGANDGINGCVPYPVRIELRKDRPRRKAEKRE